MRQNRRNLEFRNDEEEKKKERELAGLKNASTETYFGYERRQRGENILVVHLGTNFISTVDTQISVQNTSPGGKKKKAGMKQSNKKKQRRDSPQRSGSFDDDLFLRVRESADQRSDDVFAL